MDRHTRRDLKTDKFALEISNTWDFLADHKTESIRYGGIGLAVIALAIGFYFYRNHAAVVREDALAQAMRIDDATVGGQIIPTNLHFDTEADKEKAHVKAFNDLTSKYRGTQEGAIAGLFLAADASDKGDMAEAERRYKDLVASAPKPYAAVAQISLAQVYAAESKFSDAEKVLRDLIAHPAFTVSKEEATIVLGQVLAKSNPAEARKILEPLRNSRGTVSQAAVNVLGQIPPTASK